MQKVKLKRTTLEGIPGYGLKIVDINLSIQDLLTEVNQFFEKGKIERLWPEGCSDCFGCDLCCHEPLPVTSIDVENISRAKNVSFTDAFKYLRVETRDNIVDITLKRTRNNRCVFLNKDGICSIYKYRPFICQTYICCQTEDAVEELRSQVVNQGMDELIRTSIIAFKNEGRDLPVNYGKQGSINLEDWHKNCFTGKHNYAEVALKNVLSANCMKALL